MSRLLVTGGAGFIGANFVRYWIENHPDDRVVVLDALTYAGNLQSLESLFAKPQFRFIRCDVCEQDTVASVLKEDSIDTIVHFAAESHVDRSIARPDAFIHTNVVGTFSLLEAARQEWLAKDVDHRFHHVSTDEVFGSLGPDDAAFTETTTYAPNSPYSASKAGSDHLVRAYQHTYGLQVTTSNCSNNYGPYQFPEKLIPLMIINALEGKPLPVYGDGSNIRDWLHVSDHVRAIELVLKKGRPGDTYNVGGNEEHSNLAIVKTLCTALDELLEGDESLAKRFPKSPKCLGDNTESMIAFVADRPGHDWRYAIDPEKIESELGFRPLHSFESGLRQTIKWMLENEQWWRSVQDESYRSWIARNYSSR